MKILFRISCLCAALLSTIARGQDKPAIEFHDGDRIVFVGNDFFDHDQERGYIETQLTSRFPDKNLTFRNLGYSGDTVEAGARNLCSGWAVFGPADQGFDRLKNLIDHIKPTIVFVAYGMNESFDGPDGLSHFQEGLNHIVSMLTASSAKLVLVSPIRHEDLGRPLPDPSAHNKNLRLYCDAIQKMAQDRHGAFIDLYEALGDGAKTSPPQPLTYDGIHLNPYGYWRAAIAIEQGLGYAPRTWSIELTAKGEQPHAVGTKVDEIKSDGATLGFRATDEMLPLAASPLAPPKQERILRITGLQPGHYALAAGTLKITASAEDWSKGVDLASGPATEQEEHLRHTILAKNFDFFNFWRPDNDTYIFGYRKHEQGRNAVEIPKFEPLVEAKEAEIARLRMPVPQNYVLTRENAK